MNYLVKTEVKDPKAVRMTFTAQKTMYGGRHIAAGDTVYIFDSENDGGHGLIARGRVATSEAVRRRPGVKRQTPRVSLTIEVTAVAKHPLGRADLKPFSDWDDGRPETELNFKFYRQATNKIGGLSPEAARFLDTFF